MSNVKQQPPKTFTIEQMRKAVSTVESFKDAERVFETTKAMNFIAIRADRLLTQWGELVTAQDRMGFDFYWADPEDNQPTSVRSAKAVAEPYVLSHGNTYKAEKARRDAVEPKADELKADEPKHDFDNIYEEHTAYDDPCDPALEVKSLFDSNAHIYNTLLRIIETGGRSDPNQRRELMALGLVKHGFFTGTAVTRKGMNWMQKYIGQGDKIKDRSPTPVVRSTELRRLKSSPDE